MLNILKIILSVTAILFFNIANIYAKDLVVSGAGDFNYQSLDSVVVSGSVKAKYSKFKALVVSGSLNFSSIKVSETLTVSGGAEGDKLNCGRLEVSGSFKGENILVNGDSVISGSFDVTHAKMKANTKISGGMFASHSNFHNLEVSSDKMTLTDTLVNDITINSEGKTVQKIILKGKTIISGNITFKSGIGEVVKDKNVVINGKVVGAKVTTL